MRIIFTRHGESQANLIKQISNRGLVHPLTRRGRQQAFTLADHLRGLPIASVYSSPVLRAIETSVILPNLDRERILRLGLDHTVRIVAELRGAGLVCVSWNNTPL